MAERQVIEQARKDGKPIILVLNKVDEERNVCRSYRRTIKRISDAYVPLSAKFGDGRPTY